MKRPPLAYLLLLPLLAVLLFGNCGIGRGVPGYLSDLGYQRRTRLKEIIVKQRAERAAAQQQLHGRTLRQANRRIERATKARTDSLLEDGYEKRKFRNRRAKVERQLLPPAAAPR